MFLEENKQCTCTIMSDALRFILAVKQETEIPTLLFTGEVPTFSRIVHLRDIYYEQISE